MCVCTRVAMYRYYYSNLREADPGVVVSLIDTGWILSTLPLTIVAHTVAGLDSVVV